MSISFRDVKVADIPLLTEISVRSDPYPWNQEKISSCFASHYHNRIIFNASEIIGFAFMQIVLDEAELHYVCIQSKHQQQGYGKRLLKEIFQYAHKNGARRMFLEVRASNKGAITLYENMGFTCCGRRKAYYQSEQGREDALLMEIELSPGLI